MFAEALTIARGIKEGDEGKGFTLETIATAQAEAGLFSDAMATASEIDPNSYQKYQSQAFRDIATGQAAAGLLDDATQTIHRMHNKLEQPSIWQQDETIIWQELVSSRLKVGRFADALATADKIRDEREHLRALCDIASAQTDAGLKKDSVRTLARVSAIIRRIKPAQVDAANPTIWRLADAKLSQEVIAAADRTEDPFRGAIELEQIAVAQAKAGRREQACDTFRKATAATQKMGNSPDDQSWKIHEFCEIAEAEVKAGFEDEAGQTCMTAKKAAGGASILLCQIAAAQAHAGFSARPWPPRATSVMQRTRAKPFSESRWPFPTKRRPIRPDPFFWRPLPRPDA